MQELLPLRNQRMSESPFAFFRGSAAVMASDLATTPVSGIRVQLCGDAHLSNFGGYASPDRTLVFDLNDFDETLPGPWEWDVKRLVASVEIAGRDRGYGDQRRRRIVMATSRAYRMAMREFASTGTLDVWYTRMTPAYLRARWGSSAGSEALDALDRLVEKAMRKDSARAASKLTGVGEGGRRFLSDPPVLVPVSELLEGQASLVLEEVVRQALRSYRESLPRSRRHLLEQFRYADAARKVVGVGSVGTRAWAVLMLGVDDEPLMLQLKEASESVLAPYAGRSLLEHHGERVVAGQHLLQASSDVFLGWTRGPALDGVNRDFYVRQLWDWKVSVDLARQDPATMAIYGQLCGWTLARGHARSGDRIAIAAYLGSGSAFDEAMGDFAATYADQTERDHDRFVAATRDAG
ncbi:DUF2252 domain-containing protein [Nocardioides sp.]|uniref:DUF2252 domain-containing protein n=1 Tax=Nocardioides sp. TaxID=35761 RepID=UPI002D7E7F5D|nr:DUF2252 domain-containing protein [Nocardioides sp.]HET8961414.1 DUF2252 domain-containing protein [Nocardioides sp.]